MVNDKIKKILDFIPLLILIASAIILIWTFEINNIDFLWRHVIALIMLPINIIFFFWKHKAGVLLLGFTLCLGLLNILSYSIDITTVKISIGITDPNTPVFYAQPIFILWLILHFVISYRYYKGIWTKQYWEELLSHTSN